ncbi:hypothetical protein [Candidatus Nitrosotenuis cloacae]|uniref:HTH arsR-type domain-containing protein n=1 Tax=Candidatus Nitrosotenuis cloacae TaxID=1603555 RepID=A0A3G1BU66_9ARCH|nr:hypothetical protein [Candidatus Nitrosotenuis cloacae]AKD44119.1 hypothetical protein SU86_09350 [Candidatus Nitrosotenuis cloacae]
MRSIREEAKKKIFEVLKEAHPDDLTTAEISKRSGIFRLTLAKYLKELADEKKLRTRKIGKYVLYRRTR